MAKKSVKEILAEAMPDTEIVESEPKSMPDIAQSSRSGHSIEDLRRKYLAAESAESIERANSSVDSLRKKFLGADVAESMKMRASADDSADADDVEVVQVRPKAGTAASNVPTAPKTVIVSKTKGIIGRQG